MKPRQVHPVLRRSAKLLTAVTLTVGAAACGETPAARTQAAAAPAADGPAYDRLIVRPETRIVSGGTRYGVLRADSMAVNEDSTSARLFGVQLELVDTAGGRVAELRARGGRYDLRSQVLVAEQDVVLTGPRSGRIETEQLQVDPGTRRISSEVSTRVTWSGGGTTSYETFTVDDRFRNPQGSRPSGAPRGVL